MLCWLRRHCGLYQLLVDSPSLARLQTSQRRTRPIPEGRPSTYQVIGRSLTYQGICHRRGSHRRATSMVGFWLATRTRSPSTTLYKCGASQKAKQHNRAAFYLVLTRMDRNDAFFGRLQQRLVSSLGHDRPCHIFIPRCERDHRFQQLLENCFSLHVYRTGATCHSEHTTSQPVKTRKPAHTS